MYAAGCSIDKFLNFYLIGSLFKSPAEHSSLYSLCPSKRLGNETIRPAPLPYKSFPVHYSRVFILLTLVLRNSRYWWRSKIQETKYLIRVRGDGWRTDKKYCYTDTQSWTTKESICCLCVQRYLAKQRGIICIPTYVRTWLKKWE